MKKMLDELKKLDVEYKAPADFKDKVMNRIKTIDKEENNSRKTIHYNKYVITWVASAAVILLAFVVVIKNGRIDSTSNNSTFDSIKEDAIIDDYGDSYANEMAAKNLMSAVTESTNESIELYDDFAFEMANIEAENEIYDLLIEKNIKIVEEEQNYVIVEMSIEKTKELLKDYIDEIKLEEIDENRIKIEF